MRKHKFHHLWLIIATYGVWFAVLSGVEEITHGKFWKVFLSLVLGVIVYIIIETRLEK